MATERQRIDPFVCRLQPADYGLQMDRLRCAHFRRQLVALLQHNNNHQSSPLFVLLWLPID